MDVHSPLMGGVADLVESSDKVVELVLLETDPHVEAVVRRSRTMELPSTRNFGPGMLHVEVIPPLDGERLGGGEVSEPKDESRRPEHGDGSFKAIRQQPWCLYMFREAKVSHRDGLPPEALRVRRIA